MPHSLRDSCVEPGTRKQWSVWRGSVPISSIFLLLFFHFFVIPSQSKQVCCLLNACRQQHWNANGPSWFYVHCWGSVFVFFVFLWEMTWMVTRRGSCALSHAPVISTPKANELRMQPNILLVIVSAVPQSWSSCTCYNVLLRQIMSLFFFFISSILILFFFSSLYAKGQFPVTECWFVVETLFHVNGWKEWRPCIWLSSKIRLRFHWKAYATCCSIWRSSFKRNYLALIKPVNWP